jgi:hypothetical protein
LKIKIGMAFTSDLNEANGVLNAKVATAACQFLAVALMLCGPQISAASQQDAPASQYLSLQVQGFHVQVAPELTERKQLMNQTLRTLENKLEQIVKILRPEQVARMRRVRIWLEVNKDPAAMRFHRSLRWLEENGFDREKAYGVEISNALNFVAWTESDQPMMVLHELAHAYFEMVASELYTPLRKAWINAQALHLYESVPYVRGGFRRAYALANPGEFFAELSEAYFGRNDYFPFDRADLQRYDPIGYHLMEQAWGPRSQTLTAPLAVL